MGILQRDESVRRRNGFKRLRILHPLLLLSVLMSLSLADSVRGQNLTNSGQINNTGLIRAKNQVSGLNSNTGGRFEYFGADQTVDPSQYQKLFLTGTGIKTTGNGNVGVSDSLHISSPVTLRVKSGYLVTLGGTLVEQGYVAGQIQKQVNLSGGTTSSNFGDIGVNISWSGTAPGITTVSRTSDSSLTGNGHQSIKRFYNIAPAVNIGLTANLVFRYSNNELNGQDSSGLTLWKSTDGGTTWKRKGGTVDVNARTISKTDLSSFGLWTASDTLHPLGSLVIEGEPRNSIAIVKFSSSSRTDTTSTIAKTWGLRLKSGSATGTVIASGNASSLSRDSLADGTYYACEATDSTGWTSIGGKLGTAPLQSDTCIAVAVSNEQSRTVKFYNFRRNTITIQKYLSTSKKDTSSTIPKLWGLKLKSGSATGAIVASGNVSTLTVDSLANGTYFACEVDSGKGWQQIGYKVDGSPVVISRKDTCVSLVVSSGASRTASFWNFKGGRIKVNHFQALTAIDTSLNRPKAWGITLRMGSPTGEVLVSGILDTLTVNSDSLTDGPLFACAADSSGWSHLAFKVDNNPVQFSRTSCIPLDQVDNVEGSLSYWHFSRSSLPDTLRTLVQSNYGDGSAKVNGLPVRTVIQSLLLGNDLIVGIPGTPRSLRIKHNSASCIVDRLPAGGTAVAFPPSLGDVTIDNTTCQTPVTVLPLDKKLSKWRNVLLGQLVALKLNVRLDSYLGMFELPADSFCTARLSDASGTPAVIKAKINDAVIVNLGSGATVYDLIALADSVISGYGVGVSPSQVNQAVGTINQAFEARRVKVACGSSSVFMSGEESEEEGEKEEKPQASIPKEYLLSQNFPNPFNPMTEIQFGLPKESKVQLIIFDMLGRKVRTLVDDVLPAGIHRQRWDSRDESGLRVASGVYIYRMIAYEPTSTRGEAAVITKKMILTK